MRHTKQIALTAALLLGFCLTACDRNITRVEEVSQTTTCANCHDTTNLITGKKNQWAESVHGTGEAYLRGTSASCAGCHSGNGFATRVADGLDPDEVAAGDPNPTRQDCRACHRIHTTYTSADWALRTEDPVEFYASPGVIYNGGDGNLCVNCHQPRRIFPEAVNDSISGITSHWGPHHGPQSAMLLGVAGAGNVSGTPFAHYRGVRNTCVHCHMGDERKHTFEPEVARCQICHTEATNLDYHGVQTEVLAMIDELGARLLAAGLINENSEDGHPIVTKTSLPKAIALWNWVYVAHEDKSEGVHNPPYAKALLQAGLDALPAVVP